MAEEVQAVVEDRLAAAIKEIKFEEEEASGEQETISEEQPEEESSSEEGAEVAGEQDAEPPAEEDEPEDSEGVAGEVPDNRELNKRFAILRRREKQQEETLNSIRQEMVSFKEELSKRDSDIQKQREEFQKERESWYKKMREDPEGFAEDVAKEAGLGSGDKYYERLTHRKLNDGEITTTELMDEIKRLRQELDEKEARKAEEEQKARYEAHRQSVLNTINQEVGKALHIQRTPELHEHFPNLVKLKPEVLQARVQTATAWAIQNRPDIVGEPVMFKALDDLVGEELAYALRGQGPTETTPASAQDTPVQKPAAASRKKQLSNVDQAHRAPASDVDEDDSWDARMKRAAESMPDIPIELGE